MVISILEEKMIMQMFTYKLVTQLLAWFKVVVPKILSVCRATQKKMLVCVCIAHLQIHRFNLKT